MELRWLLALVVVCAGCALHVGEEPCEQYVHAIHERLTQCELDDDWYLGELGRVAKQCDSGPLGITVIDADQAEECIARVRATSCEQLRNGAPSCIGAFRL